jgi:hypothetical protein
MEARPGFSMANLRAFNEDVRASIAAQYGRLHTARHRLSVSGTWLRADAALDVQPAPTGERHALDQRVRTATAPNPSRANLPGALLTTM